MLTSLAPAKINLVLEVLGERTDGYHEIRSLVQTINLCDVISFEMADEISLKCTEPSLQTSNNLVIQAAELLREVSGCKKGARVELEKRIPWDAGLGGGSSDAAATLLALNNLWELGLTTLALTELAARLGSDIPFFVHKGVALIEGRGEKVTPLLVSVPGWFVLLLPPLLKMPGKTQRIYAWLSNEHFTEGQFVDKAIQEWLQSRRVSPSLLFNTFDRVALDAFQGLEKYWRYFEEAGATDIHLAGSGPTLFTLVDDEAMAEELQRHLCGQGLEAYSVSNIISEVV